MDSNSGHRSPGSGELSGVEMRRGGFWPTVLLGAVATVAVGTLPLVGVTAPVAGGALAGYRRNTGLLDGAMVGTASGLLGGLGVDLLAPPRLFGLLGGEVVGGFLLTTTLFAVVVWAIASAFGGALGAGLAGD